MGKRKVKNDEVEEEISKKVKKVKIEEVENGKEAETGDKKEYRLTTFGTNFHSKQKRPDDYVESHEMTFEQALKLIKSNRGSGKGGGIVKKQLLKHVALPYHLANKSASREAIEWISKNTVGKYKREANGIVVAIGNIKTVSPPRVIGDQMVFHTDVLIEQVVFTPKRNDEYEAVVKSVQNGLIVAVVMDLVTVHLVQSEQAISDEIAEEDRILVKYSAMKIKRSLCQLHGTYSGLVAKVAKKSKNRKTFKDEDEAEVEEEEIDNCEE